jgi:hypothetical protein
MLVGDERSVSLNPILTVFLEAIFEHFFEVSHRGQQRLPTKDCEVDPNAVELGAHSLPVPRHVDIPCISLAFLIAILASDIAGDTNGEIFDSH